MSRPAGLYILALLGVAMAVGYYYVYHGCDLENEHKEMTCEFVFKLSSISRISSSIISLTGLLASWGLLDFKPSIRSFFDSMQVNTTQMFHSPNIICEELEIHGVKAYSYTPVEIAGLSQLPVLIYFHGGGGVMLSPEVFDATLRFLANKLSLKIIAPNYSKSPEVVFPTAHEECVKITKYVFENSDELGVDAKRVSIGGDSFGSHLSLYVAFKWRELGYDEEHAPIQTMSLLYPWVQMANLELDSHLRKENQPRILSSYAVSLITSMVIKGDIDLGNLILNSQLPLLSQNYKERKSSYPHLLPEVDWDPPTSMVEQYSKYADTVLDPYASFLFQNDFSHLPPTLIIAAEYDILLTEGQLLKKRMEEAGSQVQYILYEKMFHGFFILTHLFEVVTTTFDAYDKLNEFLKEYIIIK